MAFESSVSGFFQESASLVRSVKTDHDEMKIRLFSLRYFENLQDSIVALHGVEPPQHSDHPGVGSHGPFGPRSISQTWVGSEHVGVDAVGNDNYVAREALFDVNAGPVVRVCDDEIGPARQMDDGAPEQSPIPPVLAPFDVG